MSLPDIEHRRAIIDRRAIADRLGQLAGNTASAQAAAILAEAVAGGRSEIARRLAEQPGNGRAAARATAFLHDQLVRLVHDFVIGTAPAGLALVGLGGTVRGEIAPYSDIVPMFRPAQPPTGEQ
jgi:[protein-PII] uridylyltransferase